MATYVFIISTISGTSGRNCLLCHNDDKSTKLHLKEGNKMNNEMTCKCGGKLIRTGSSWWGSEEHDYLVVELKCTKCEQHYTYDGEENPKEYDPQLDYITVDEDAEL